MVVIILEKVPASVRGELTRWMLEPRTGVFVGDISAMVREGLWTRVCSGIRDGGALLIHSADSEQGFRLRLHGTPSRAIIDFEGISLIQIPS